MSRIDLILSHIETDTAELRDLESKAADLKARIKGYKAEVARLRKLERAKQRYLNDPKRAALNERKAAAQKRLQEGPSMRRAGLTYPEIAAAWNLTVSQAREIVRKAERIEAYRQANP